jgi:hypothetical protein
LPKISDHCLGSAALCSEFQHALRTRASWHGICGCNLGGVGNGLASAIDLSPIKLPKITQ